MKKGLWGVLLFLLIVQGVFLLSSQFVHYGLWTQYVAAFVMFLALFPVFRGTSFFYGLPMFLVCFSVMIGTVRLLTPKLGVLLSSAIGVVLLYVCSILFVFRETPKVMRSPVFVVVLLVKLGVLACFASDYLLHGVLPLVEHFSSTLMNPYDALSAATVSEAYPLSPLVLLLVGVFSTASVSAHPFVMLFFAKLPILLADIIILLVVSKFLPGREKPLLWFYWCSPIVLYVAYMQGQLDLIPAALLFAALYFFFMRRDWLGSVLLGLGSTAKANILLAVPFVFYYLWRKRVHVLLLGLYGLVIAGIMVAGVAPVMFSEGFQTMLMMSRAEAIDFILGVPIVLGTQTLYLIPLLLLLFGLRLTYYRVFLRDGLLMSLTVAYILLVVFVPSASGWFLWSYPFVAYFFVKESRISQKHLWLYTMAFLGYFLLYPRTEFHEVFQLITHVPNLHIWVGQWLPMHVVTDIAFTGLFAMMLLIGIWVYQHGIVHRFQKKQTFYIGIAGDSGTGKSTLNGFLQDLFGAPNVNTLEGDDMHKWARGAKQWERMTHLNPHANKLHEDLRMTKRLSGSPVSRRKYDHGTGKFTSPEQIKTARFVLVSGLHSFYLEEMRRQLDLKVFLDPAEQLRVHWKVQRDLHERGYTKTKVRQALAARKKDRESHILPQRGYADVVVSFTPVRKMTEKQIWGKRSPAVKLSLLFKNSFNLDPLVSALSEHVSVQHTIDIEWQRLTISGAIKNEQLQRLAYVLIPDLQGLTEYHEPQFHEDYDGLLQLIMLYLISIALEDELH